MIRRPEFTIIAGPNGAGKSRLGPFYSSTKAFDGDNLAMKLRKEHPDWKDSWVEGVVISTLMKEKDEAILLNRDYAFETNFSSDLPIKLINDFKKADYKICLIYFGLSYISDSSTRVDQRQVMGGAQRKSGGDRIQLYRRYQACTCLACSLREHSFCRRHI